MSPDRLPEDRSYQNLMALNKKFDEQLTSLGKENKSDTGPAISGKKVLLNILLVIIGLVLPFIVLVRTSVYLYLQYSFNGWMALAAGVVATIVLLLLYSLAASYRLRGKMKVNKYIARGIAVMVISYTLYGLLYYSSMHTKTDDVNNYYRTLHPIMRVTLTTATLADSDLLVTDIQREPLDYVQMDMEVNRNSLHFMQADGYVHAVDLRTNNRAQWENVFTQLVFNVVGLRTLRHEGSADHLHVYLPLNN